MREQVKLNVFYAHPPEKVWQALTDCRILSVWMMKNDFKPRIGHQFKFESNSLPGIKTIIYCEVVEIQKPKRLAYTWQDNVTGKPSLVIWTLTPVEDGTQLQLKHQQTGYATTIIPGKKGGFGQIGTRAGLFLDRQPVASINKQILKTGSLQLATRDELNFLLNQRNSVDEWNCRLNCQLAQVLQSSDNY